MANRPFSLDDAVVLVSGGGRGLGRACAELLARCGAMVALSARTTTEVETAAAAVRDAGGRAHAFTADVGDVASHEALVEAVEAACGPLTGLVNVAGISTSFARAERLTPEEFDAVQHVNQRGTFFLTQAVAKRWIEREAGGSVVTVSSISAQTGLPRLTAYAMSRAAVEAMTKTLAAEWAVALKQPILVNCVSPGFIETTFTAGLPEWYAARTRAHTAMQRWGNEDEVAGAVAFLLSNEASYITGTVIEVSGGYGLWSLDAQAGL